MSHSEPTEFFAHPTDSTSVEVAGLGTVDVPGFFYPHRLMAGIFTADFDAVQARLPSDSLHPVRWGRDRAAMLVKGEFYPYADGPSHRQGYSYGESGVYALVTHGDHGAPPYVPLLGLPVPEGLHWGIFTLHAPVSAKGMSAFAKLTYGLPTFPADLRYEERRDHDRLVVEEGGLRVYTLTVSTQGRMKPADDHVMVYSDRDGDLLATRMHAAGSKCQNRGHESAALELGDHPVADDLRSMEIDEYSTVSMFMPDRHAVLHLPERIGSAQRRHDGFTGGQQDARMVLSQAPGFEREIPPVVPR